MVFTGHRSAVCFQHDCGNYHVSAATCKPAPMAKTKVMLFRIFLFGRSMLANLTHRCLPLQSSSQYEQSRARQLLQSESAQWGIEERRKLRHDNATGQSFAVPAIESAQLRHRLRLQRSSNKQSPHSTVDLDTSCIGMQQAEFSSFTISMLKQQCHSQPLLNRWGMTRTACHNSCMRVCMHDYDRKHAASLVSNPQCYMLPARYAAQTWSKTLCRGLWLMLSAVQG